MQQRQHERRFVNVRERTGDGMSRASRASRCASLPMKLASHAVAGWLCWVLVGGGLRVSGAPVRVGIYDNMPKVGMGETGPEGIFVDIIEAIAAKENWELEYVSGTWREGLDRVAAGEIDLMPDVAQSKSRGARFAFHSEPVLSDWFQVYARKGSGIRSVMDLAGKRVAVLDGSIQEEAFNQMYADFNVSLTLCPFPDYRSALRDVAQGRTDAVVVNRFHGMQYSRARNLEDTAIIFSPTRLFFAASPQNHEALLKAIDSRLIQLKRDPGSAYFRSLKRWTSESTPFQLPRWLKITGLAVAGLLALSMAWILLLRRLVVQRSADLAARSRWLRMLYDSDQAMVRCADEQALLGKFCAILTADGDYRAAWVSLAGDGTGDAFRVAAQSGCDDAGFDRLNRACATDGADGSSLAAQVLQRGQPLAFNTHAEAPAAFRNVLQALRIREGACLCLPLLASGVGLGTLTVVTSARGPLPPEAVDFLKEYAGNLAFGIEHWRLERTKQRAEEALRQSEARFRELIEKAPEAILIQTQGRVVFLNPAACTLLGVESADRLIGQSVMSFIPSGSRSKVQQQIMLVVEQQMAGVLSEEEWIRADGVPVKVEVIAAPFVYERQKGSLVFARDLTERKMLEEQLSQSQKMETIGLLAGGVAHDFNNVLQMILGFTELALLESGEDDPRTADLREVLATANRAKLLTGQLLAFSRKMPMELTRIQLNEQIKSRETMFARLLGEDVLIVSSLDTDLPEILADAGHIEQVLLNLAVNARDAMPHGGQLTIRTSRVMVDAATPAPLQAVLSPGCHACLAIADTGAGMSAEIQKKIFDPFFTTKQQGSGLGLSTVYGIVKQLKGWIQVDSHVGRGTTFTIYFPAAAEGARRSEEEVPAARGKPVASTRILVVEDMRELGCIAQRILVAHGYRVEIATSLAEARAALREPAAYEMIFSDVVLGDGNGFDLAEAVWRDNPAIRVVFASGYADGRVRLETLGKHGWKCLAKPYTAQDLLDAVDEALGSTGS